MTVKELIEELKNKPPTYEVILGYDERTYQVHEVATDHDRQIVVIW